MPAELGQRDKVSDYQLGSLSENTRSHHFQFDKGQRAIIENNNL